ncbi:MAG TPA: large-conductance mechanosensitive channel protein MscL [Firmicutes bacterium]|nr:large-conductance mechanosensitive channel protein MscL [Bacillota bacterium]
MLKEFKEFAMRGNVIDLAVGVVIGGSFSKIVSSLVNDIVMPLLGLITGKVDLTSLQVTVVPASTNSTGLSINYGLFLQSVLDFLVIAFSVFLVIKAINSFKKKEQVAPKAPPVPSKQEVLLEEIRDLLKVQAN